MWGLTRLGDLYHRNGVDDAHVEGTDWYLLPAPKVGDSVRHQRNAGLVPCLPKPIRGSSVVCLFRVALP